MFKKSRNSEMEAIREQVISLAATRDSYFQNQGRECYEIEKEVCLLTLRYILLKLSKIFWIATVICAVPGVICSVFSKIKK